MVAIWSLAELFMILHDTVSTYSDRKRTPFDDHLANQVHIPRSRMGR